MIELSLREMLLSSDPDMILDGLYILGSERNFMPDKDVFRSALIQFENSDPDIRRQAVVAVAIHWGLKSSFSLLLRLLDKESDEFVMEAVIMGIIRIAKENQPLREKAFGCLRKICIESEQSDHLKSIAYVEVRWLMGKTNAAEHAAESLNPENIVIDVTWLNKKTA